MVDAADGFPYNVRYGSDLIQYDLGSLKETDLTDFDFDDSTTSRMNEINQNNHGTEIKETVLIGDDGDNQEEIRETNLTENDSIIQEVLNLPVMGNNKKSSEHDDGDSEPWHLDTAESICLSTDSGIINDKATFELDIDDNLTVKFQDIESDFFETDCEAATDFESTKDKFTMNRHGGETKDIVKFQDLESDFFETDCEATDTEQKFNKKAETNSGEAMDMVKFQDIESDFFETDCEGMDNPPETQHDLKFQDIESDFFDEENDETNENRDNSTPKKCKPEQKPNKDRTYRTKKDALLVNQENLLAKLNNEKQRRVSMTNSLLRSTIDELERALTNSNALLTNRDQTIQDLRKRNLELKKSLSEELENNAQLKLLVMTKDSIISEKDTAINELQTDLDKINKEIYDLRLYKLNNIQRYDVSYDNLNDSTETDLVDNSTESIHVTSNNSNAIETLSSKRTYSCPEKNYTSKCPLARSKSHTSTEQPPPISRCTRFKQEEGTATKTKTTTKQSKMLDETSSTELHARLQIKFMRDAFFHYMIGFHSDEQINAILAILDYGDKRQDFVLEAHKLKKNGKKFNVKKVSTRGLTFVQDIQDV